MYEGAGPWMIVLELRLFESIVTTHGCLKIHSNISKVTDLVLKCNIRDVTYVTIQWTMPVYFINYNSNKNFCFCAMYMWSRESLSTPFLYWRLCKKQLNLQTWYSEELGRVFESWKCVVVLLFNCTFHLIVYLSIQ